MKIVAYTVLFLAILAGAYFVYQEYQLRLEQQELLQQLQTHITQLQTAAGTAQIPVVAVQQSVKCWSDIQCGTKDTVVQIFSHGAQFNWLEPYKTPQQFQASGSGFFINDQGKIKIITNAHVINEAKAVFIQIPSLGKRRFEVLVKGVSPERDLAVLELLPEEEMTIAQELGAIGYLPLGNSDTVHRAEEIMALGYPLGQQALKSTTGVISGREHVEGHSLFQISAAINPGSSGGPSLNLQGEVIGVTVAGVTSAQNVGYIIPANEVKLFLRQLEHVPTPGDDIKFLRKPFLGVMFNNATEQLTSFLNNPLPGGLYVVETFKGSPLQKAGVLPGDMIYEIDGHKIDLYGEMSVPWSEDHISIIDYVSRLMLGDAVHLTVYRHGSPQKLTLQFNQSELAPIRIMYPGYEKIDSEVFGGLVFMQLAMNHLPLLLQGAPELARYMEFKNQMEPAVIITHVFPDSVAARTRTIGAGAVIKEINGHKVKTLAEVRDALSKSGNNDFLTLKTTENVFTVMNMKQLIQQEPRLASQYYFKMSPIMQALIEKQKSQ